MRVQAITGDITTMEVDAIVNAANNAMIIGGGVDGAIHKAAGQELINYNAQHHGFGCPTGLVKVTPGFNLPAEFILHTVGPDMRLYTEELGDLLLAQCYGNCMKLAIKEGLKSIAFPAISTGIFGFNKKRAAKIAAETVMLWKTDPEAKDLDVTFACFAEKDAVTINKALETIDEEQHYLTWSMDGVWRDDTGNGVEEFIPDLRTPLADGVYPVRVKWVDGKVGEADGITIKDGKFVLEPTLRAVAVARNNVGYWGTFLEGLTFDSTTGVFTALLGS